MEEKKNPIFTIGHSTHSLEEFIKLLRIHNVNAVADVRSTPYSRYTPQFNKDTVEGNLKKHGIKYVFLGRELGGRSDNPACFENGRIRFIRLAQTELFRNGIQRLIQGAQDNRIALMCAEKEPLDCHRTLLVARALVERGVIVGHILANGKLESYQASIKRLLSILGLSQLDLFRSQEELIKEALALQEEHVAYVSKELSNNQSGEFL